MGYIVKDDIEYGGINKIVPNEKSFDNIDAYLAWKSSSEYDPETTCYVKGIGFISASLVNFDNTDTSLQANNVQGAIRELSDGIQSLKSYEVEEKRSNIPLSIGGHGYVNITIDITKDGYTPILVSPKGTNHVDCVIVGVITTSSPATITVYNLASSAQTVTAVIYVLYEKNS